ncbi:MAG: helix-turn-helix domain-containing protein [Bacteroides sp.]|nr:helix-turn-helix domain-containing protein [Bacteroides sp.]
MDDKEILKDNVKENVRERFREIMMYEQLTAGEFAENIKVAQATISQILRGRNMPSTEVLFRLHERYPEISLNWLLTGEGNMRNGEKTNTTSETEDDASGLPSFADDTANEDYPLFAKNAENTSSEPTQRKNRKEIALETPQMSTKEIVKQEIIYKERPPRKITEIRIFFDDNTYETFKPEK